MPLCETLPRNQKEQSSNLCNGMASPTHTTVSERRQIQKAVCFKIPFRTENKTDDERTLNHKGAEGHLGGRHFKMWILHFNA